MESWWPMLIFKAGIKFSSHTLPYHIVSVLEMCWPIGVSFPHTQHMTTIILKSSIPSHGIDVSKIQFHNGVNFSQDFDIYLIPLNFDGGVGFIVASLFYDLKLHHKDFPVWILKNQTNSSSGQILYKYDFYSQAYSIDTHYPGYIENCVSQRSNF